MRKTRFIALLCAIILTLSLAPMASAATRSRIAVDGVFSWDSSRVVMNGETVSLHIGSNPYSMYEMIKSGEYTDSSYWNDLIFDCEGKITAKSNVGWIHVAPTKNSFILSFDTNNTKSPRSGNVTVTGSNYRATLIFKQYGFDKIVSVKQNKKKVTVKFNFSKGCDIHVIDVYCYQSTYDEKNDVHKSKSETIYSGPITKSTFSFTVKKGWHYSVNIGPGLKIKTEWGSYNNSFSGDYVSFDVDSVSAKKTIK